MRNLSKRVFTILLVQVFLTLRHGLSAPFEASVPGQLQVTNVGPGGCGQGTPLPWSNPDTWGGEVPVVGSNIVIPACEVVLLDVVTPVLGQVNILGTLIASSSVDVGITANSIFVFNGGVLQIGTAAQPYARNATITLTGPRGTHTPRTNGIMADNALDNDGLSRALRVMDGGTLRLFGATPPLLKTKLNAHANAGATSLTVADAVNWRAGDKIAVSLTDFYGVGETEILTLANNTSGTILNTTSSLRTFRWGRLQYVTDNGMSLTPAPFTPPSPDTATVLDERAQIVNLSRRIVIQGADDADWNNNGFGAHVMIMGLGSTAQVRGVEFRRVGQRRAMGRYPWHWHMLSYTAANGEGVGGGQYLGDVDSANHFLRDSAVWNSQNRAVTIHGTNGVTVDNVYAVDIKGHAFFMEDGSEERNFLSNNVAMKIRNPGNGNHLKVHDTPANFGGSSGFWLTNPNNTIVGNTGSDAEGRGIWNSFQHNATGLSRNANIRPRNTDLLLWENNTGHSNGLQGILTNFIVYNEAGDTEEYRYQPPNVFTLTRGIVWKNKDGGYKNRVEVPRYMGWIAADNEGRDISGFTAHYALLQDTLLVGSSLNNATPFADSRRIGLASYHFTLDIKNLLAVNYPFVAPPYAMPYGTVYGGGVFDHSDMYIKSIGVCHVRNTGWRLINSNAGYLTPAPYFDGFPLGLTHGWTGLYRYWTLTGAILDSYGHWGPAGNYLLPSTDPFFTYGLSSSVAVAPAGQNGVSTPDIFYGIASIQINEPSNWEHYNGPTQATCKMARWNSSNVEVGEHTLGDPLVTAFFPQMRGFTIAKGGRYVLTYPNGPMATTRLHATLYNAFRPTDTVLLGLPWSGAVPVTGSLNAGTSILPEAQRVSLGYSRMYRNTGTSLNDVINDPTGVTIWQDSANNRVWINYVGGGLVFPQIYPPLSDEDLERAYTIKLRAQ